MATTSYDDLSVGTPELLSAAQLSREAKVSIRLVQDRLNMGEIKPDFRSGRTQLFNLVRLPELREALRRRY